MTNPHLLTYGKSPVRVHIDASGIWLAATDIFAAFRLLTDRGCLARMAPEHLKLLPFPSDQGPVRLTAVSPLGAVTIAKALGAPRDRMLDGWVRNHGNRLADEHGLPRLDLTLLADGTLPVKPRVSHDNYLPWGDLQRRHPSVRPFAANLYEPALFDEDPSLPPHAPDTGISSINKLLAAGTIALRRDVASEGAAA